MKKRKKGIKVIVPLISTSIIVTYNDKIYKINILNKDKIKLIYCMCTI